MAPRKTFVIGAGCTKFDHPNKSQRDYPEIAVEAASKALLDAGITYDEVEQAYVGYVYGDSTCGQRALYALGMSQIPIINVNNNCSTGSSALYLAKQMVESGACEVVMALGFEKMAAGSLTAKFEDRTNPLDKTIEVLGETAGIGAGPFAAQIFGSGAAEYIDKYAATWDHVGKIAAKNHKHSTANPYSQFQTDMTFEQVMKDKKVTDNLTRAMCCPTSDGGACAIVASEDFVRKRGLTNNAIEIASLAMTTDSPRLYEDRSPIELAGSDMTRRAATMAYDAAGVKPEDIKVIECHDCFAANELLTYDALGLCKPGQAHEVVERGDFTYGGKWVINPSGGLESKGHPLGATGLAMTFYLVMQLRGWAGKMQVPEIDPAKQGSKEAYAMAHNIGLGGSCVVAIFKRPSWFKAGGQDGRARLGYNHGAEYKALAEGQVEKVQSRTRHSPYAARL